MVTSFPLSFPCVPNFFAFLAVCKKWHQISVKLIMLTKAELDMRQFATKKCEEGCEKGIFYKRLLITMHQDMCWKFSVKALCSTDPQAHWTSDSCAKHPTKMAWFKYQHMLRNSKALFHQLDNNNSFYSMFLCLVLYMFLQHIILCMVCVMAWNAEWTYDFSIPMIMFQYNRRKMKRMRRNLKRSVEKGRKIKHQSRLDRSKQDFP